MNKTKLLAFLLSAALSASIAASGPADIADAAQNKNAVAVKKLLKEGADVNAAQGDGMTALHWAALNGDAEIAQMLLYAGANVGAKTRLGGYTPLHLAAQVGNASVIAPLIAAGASVTAVTSTGATALMEAAHAGSTEAVRTLLENGADPNLKETANGQTALMFAAAADRIDVVKLLLSRGADLKATSRVEDFASLKIINDVDQNGVPRQQAPPPPGGKDIAGVTRPFNYNELIGKHGGLSRSALRRPAGRNGDCRCADRRRRRRQPALRGRSNDSAAGRRRQRPFRSRQRPARQGRQPESRRARTA